MYSLLVAQTKIVSAIKPKSDYDFFVYQGKTINLPFRGKDVPLTKGQRFGVRKSASKKQIRLIMGDDLTRVFTLTLDDAKKIARGVQGGAK